MKRSLLLLCLGFACSLPLLGILGCAASRAPYIKNATGNDIYIKIVRVDGTMEIVNLKNGAKLAVGRSAEPFPPAIDNIYRWDRKNGELTKIDLSAIAPTKETLVILE